MNTLISLFIEFFKTGLFAVGGGLATLPFLKDIALRYDWFTPSELTDMIAVSEATPGPIGVNMSTYAGYKAGSLATESILGGFLYGAFATLSLILPSVIIVLIVSQVLTRFRDSRAVKGIFYGIRPASAALITAAILDVLVTAVCGVGFRGLISGGFESLDFIAVAIFAVFVPLAANLKKIHPLVFIAAGAVIGLVLY